MTKKLEKELKKLNAKRGKLSKFLSKQNKKTLPTTQLELLKEQKQAISDTIDKPKPNKTIVANFGQTNKPE